MKDIIFAICISIVNQWNMQKLKVLYVKLLRVFALIVLIIAESHNWLVSGLWDPKNWLVNYEILKKCGLKSLLDISVSGRLDNLIELPISEN